MCAIILCMFHVTTLLMHIIHYTRQGRRKLQLQADWVWETSSRSYDISSHDQIMKHDSFIGIRMWCVLCRSPLSSAHKEKGKRRAGIERWTAEQKIIFKIYAGSMYICTYNPYFILHVSSFVEDINSYTIEGCRLSCGYIWIWKWRMANTYKDDRKYWHSYYYA